MPVDERKRRANEVKFENWIGLPDGRRRYLLEVSGRSGWKAIYYKEVDTEETTIRFWQEIHDDKGNLVETHNKFPKDEGHQKIGSSQ